MTGERFLAETLTYFKTKDRLTLYCKAKLADPGKASIVFMHGVGEHIGRYQEAFAAFSGQGYDCFGFDQRGFGRSEGERGHVDRFSDYADDLAIFIDDIVHLSPIKPVFLFGHSMGSIVALDYALNYPDQIQGLLIFSCPIKLDSYLATLGSYVANDWSAIMPTFKIPNFIDPRALSNNPSNIAAFSSDPYAFSKVSISWLREFTQARTTVLNQAQNITLPVLVSHGEADTIAALSGAMALFKSLSSKDKTLNIYPDMKHELLNHATEQRAKVLADAFAWLDRQCAKQSLERATIGTTL